MQVHDLEPEDICECPSKKQYTKEFISPTFSLPPKTAVTLTEFRLRSLRRIFQTKLKSRKVRRSDKPLVVRVEEYAVKVELVFVPEDRNKPQDVTVGGIAVKACSKGEFMH